jgi:hypothetical protein
MELGGLGGMKGQARVGDTGLPSLDGLVMRGQPTLFNLELSEMVRHAKQSERRGVGVGWGLDSCVC